MSPYDEAVQALARVPLSSFVAERKRLAGMLRAAGDKEAAKALSGRRRPATSAWAVNQLYWESRETFDALLAAAERVRRGDRAAAGEHRQAMSTLRQRGAAILEAAGHTATEVILRRVTNTLAALAVAGGFAPDVAGALTDDRDPPGFEAMATMVSERAARSDHPPDEVHARGAAADDDADERMAGVDAEREPEAAIDEDVRERQRAAEAYARAAADAARRAADDVERAHRTAERARLDAELRAARATLDQHESTLAAAHRALHDAEAQVAASRDVVDALERERETLGDDDV